MTVTILSIYNYVVYYQKDFKVLVLVTVGFRAQLHLDQNQ